MSDYLSVPLGLKDKFFDRINKKETRYFSMHFSIEMCTYLPVNTTLYPKDDTFIPISFDDSFKHVNSNAPLLLSIFFLSLFSL